MESLVSLGYFPLEQSGGWAADRRYERFASLIERLPRRYERFAMKKRKDTKKGENA